MLLKGENSGPLKKLIFILLIVQALPSIRVNGQDSLNPMNKQDKYLRVVVSYTDPNYVLCDCGDNLKNSAYKFQLKKLAMGKYDHEDIIICVMNDGFAFERQRWGGNQTTFYWTLDKTDKFYNKLPVYVKRGNF